MRILVCSLEPPLPPFNGLRLQVAALVAELHREHQVRVLALRGDADGKGAGDDWMGLLAPPRRGTAAEVGSVVRGVLRREPRNASALAAWMAGPLREEIRAFGPDVVHVTPGRLAGLHPGVTGVPSVLGALDAWHLNLQASADAEGTSRLRRALVAGEVRRIRRFVRIAYPAFDRVVVVSDEDRTELQACAPGLAVEVIPNGVDVEAYAHDGSVRDRSQVIFTGVMDYPPNVAAAETLARRIMPAVRSECPEAHLVLAGRTPGPSIRALGPIEWVQVTGEVADLRPLLSGSGVFACPMVSGTGIKNKLLEAMANGLACVVTPRALQGLSAVRGRDLLVADDAEGFAGAVRRLLRDPALAGEVGRSGLKYVTEHHSWTAAARRYVGVYGDAAERTRRR